MLQFGQFLIVLHWTREINRSKGLFCFLQSVVIFFPSIFMLFLLTSLRMKSKFTAVAFVKLKIRIYLWPLLPVQTNLIDLFHLFPLCQVALYQAFSRFGPIYEIQVFHLPSRRQVAQHQSDGESSKFSNQQSDTSLSSMWWFIILSEYENIKCFEK